VAAAYDAVVVGSGPNGLAAAIRLGQAGLRVVVVEAGSCIGGGARSGELTLPGFTHDICSAIHPLAVGSPFFSTLPLSDHGLDWIEPPLPLAHPFEDGTAAVLHRSLEGTVAILGEDGLAYDRLMRPLVDRWQALANEFLQPMLHWPAHPVLMARFGFRGLPSASWIAKRSFKHEPARALFAGLAAHSFLSLEQLPSSAFAIVLALFGHAVGWPMPRGGSGLISDALARYFRTLGGEIMLDTPVNRLDDGPTAPVKLFEVTPRQFVRIAGDRMTDTYRKRLNGYRYGPGVFKIDYALNAPIPWRANQCSRAGTIHLGGTFDEVAYAERQVMCGAHPDKPFVLVTQPTLFDPTRAPSGKHIAWAYTHVPNGSTVDMTDRIERQFERFAPGFRDLVLARHTMNCADLERRNPNLIGGDINGGAADLFQLIARPTFSSCPYRTPISGVYLCSASTPPGGGVHGMCGFHAANAALQDLRKI
jgi:phytoene dehydrogenase-like protein